MNLQMLALDKDRVPWSLTMRTMREIRINEG